MSKQPRGKVRIGVGNTVGERVSNVFVDVKKFQERYAEAMSKTTREGSQVSLKSQSSYKLYQILSSYVGMFCRGK